jgi:hypothetical protein
MGPVFCFHPKPSLLLLACGLACGEVGVRGAPFRGMNDTKMNDDEHQVDIDEASRIA